MLVTDFPIWTDCPFRDRVPAQYEIRRETIPGEGVIVSIIDQDAMRHVDFGMQEDEELGDQTIDAFVRALSNSP